MSAIQRGPKTWWTLSIDSLQELARTGLNFLLPVLVGSLRQNSFSENLLADRHLDQGELTILLLHHFWSCQLDMAMPLPRPTHIKFRRVIKAPQLRYTSLSDIRLFSSPGAIVRRILLENILTLDGFQKILYLASLTSSLLNNTVFTSFISFMRTARTSILV